MVDKVGPQPEVMTIPIRYDTDKSIYSAETEKRMDSNWPIVLMVGISLLAWYVLKDTKN